MRQINIAQPGGPEVLVLGEGPVPTPAAGEVLIQVQAAGVNRADTLQRKGNYPLRPGMSSVPGLEASGTIAATGPGVDRWKVGDSVCALLTGGGYAEYAVAPAGQCLPFPAGLNAIEAGSLPETFFTVWLDVFEFGGLKPAERLLVHGGSSGIGITAIQLAHSLGSTVYATAGSDDKCEACRKLGAAAAFNYRTSDFEKEVQRATEGRGVDVILDMVGGSYTPKNLRILGQDGRLIHIHYFESRLVEVDLALVISRHLTITGSGLRPQSPAKKASIAQALEKTAWPLISAGTIKPVIDRVFPLEQAAEAHRLMESSTHIGKIMLSVTGP
jgi:putative PIG3 family NAD(P)H quinone oxidoreductase